MSRALVQGKYLMTAWAGVSLQASGESCISDRRHEQGKQLDSGAEGRPGNKANLGGHRASGISSQAARGLVEGLRLLALRFSPVEEPWGLRDPACGLADRFKNP